MRLDDLQESGNVEDRRGEGGYGGGGGGFPIGGGGIGIGTIVVLGLIGWALGIDPSILIGGAFLLICDTVARLALQPQAQLPVGVVTALIGGPFFVALLIGQKRRSELWGAR